MKLTDRIGEDVIEYKGREIRLSLFFDRVLRAFELLNDPYFTEAEKVEILLHMLVENYDAVADLGIEEKLLIVNTIFDRFVAEGDGQGDGEKPPYDLEKDAEYIYASFLYDYGIDLFEQQGRLHWKKFKALLAGLSDESIFKRVVAIRTTPLPPPNKYNQEERRRLMELKQAFSLDRAETVEEIDRKFDELALMMKSWAKGGKANDDSHRRTKTGNPRRDRGA